MDSRPRRPARALGLALGSLLVASLSVELGWRLWLAASGETYDGAVARERIERVVAQLNDRLADYGAGQETPENRHGHVVHPYAGFTSEGLVGALPRYLERFGKRRARAYFDVVVVGGSVAGMTSQPLRDVLPDRLEGHLPEGMLGTRVTNLAMGAIKQPQQTTLVAYLLSRGIRPDAIVNIDGFNEVALGNQNALVGADPVFPSVSHWTYLLVGPTPDPDMLELMLAVRAGQLEASALAETARRFGLLRSAVTGGWVRARMESIGRATSLQLDALNEHLAGDTANPATRGAPIPEEHLREHPQAPVRLSVRSWFEASISLDAMCDARDILYLQVLQPTLHDAGSKPLTPAEIADGKARESWIAGAETGYPLLREQGAELLDRGVEWLDASGLFANVPETIYVDACHYDERGGRMLAELIADELTRVLESR